MKNDSKIFIAGRKGLVGSAIERRFREASCNNIIGLGSKELDLKNQLIILKERSLNTLSLQLLKLAG